MITDDWAGTAGVLPTSGFTETSAPTNCGGAAFGQAAGMKACLCIKSFTALLASKFSSLLLLSPGGGGTDSDPRGRGMAFDFAGKRFSRASRRIAHSVECFPDLISSLNATRSARCFRIASVGGRMIAAWP